ncbi:MAG: hypothetical protein QCI38_08075, partial [Candidatus Thermoplasmatota archaeon]|nr:hypothetical protein [Candidatus Thermoplasmatota archaeon]
MKDQLIHCDILVSRYGRITVEDLQRYGQEAAYFRISFSLKGFEHFAATTLHNYVCHEQTYLDCIQLMKQIRRTRKNETTLK